MLEKRQGLTVFSDGPQEAGTAVLKMPDGREIEVPVLADNFGGEFLDVRSLHPR